tara:strand:+ start:158 stop:466 length:309 start_codon:yes stop_codon:yes gene_type:complete
MNNNTMEDLCEKNVKVLLNNNKKITLPFLSKYEKAKILGLRIQQLSTGANTTLLKEEYIDLKSNVEIAEKELKLKKIPLIISRRLPNNKRELWHVKDLLDLD